MFTYADVDVCERFLGGYLEGILLNEVGNVADTEMLSSTTVEELLY